MRFHDRIQAGRALAERLRAYAGRSDVIVLALPRGGVPVGYEVAAALGAPLDVFLVRKLGVPGHPELAMGALAGNGIRILTRDIIDEMGIGDEAIEHVTAAELAELARRERAYRGARPAPVLSNRTIILVDDGLATGATMEAAVAAARQGGPARIVVAAPVGAPETCARLASVADEVVCVETPRSFQAVGLWYDRFEQTSDEEVVALLERGRTP